MVVVVVAAVRLLQPLHTITAQWMDDPYELTDELLGHKKSPFRFSEKGLMLVFLNVRLRPGR